jgi:hypothetical protein
VWLEGDETPSSPSAVLLALSARGRCSLKLSIEPGGGPSRFFRTLELLGELITLGTSRTMTEVHGYDVSKEESIASLRRDDVEVGRI